MIPSTSAAAAIAAAGAEELEELLADLVAIPSHSGIQGREKAVAEFIAGRFAREGIESWVEQAGEGRVNVLAVLRGSGGGRSLLLSGHTDTVPPYGMERPYELIRDEGRLRGRGAVDMKGALAAMMEAMFAIRRSDSPLAGDLWFAGVADEEEGSAGTIALIEGGRRWDGAVVGEPSGLDICVAHRGLEWLSFTFEGKAAHSGRLEEGVNAIDMAAAFLSALDRDMKPAAAARRHPRAGPEVVSVGLIRGGTQPSTIPGDCEVQLDYRWIPGRSWPEVEAEFRALLAGLASADPEFRCIMSVVPASVMREGWRHEAMEIDPDHPLVAAAAAALAAAGIGAPRLAAFPAWSDAGLLSSRGGVPSIVLGPGDSESAHSERECISAEQLRLAAGAYARLALGFCGTTGNHG